MKKIVSLTSVMMKTTLQALTTTKKETSPLKMTLRVLGIFIIYVYLSGVVYFMSRSILEMFIALGQQDLILNIVFLGASVYALVIAVVTVPSIFYFSKDIEVLLPLPLKPIEILVAKTATTYLSLLLALSFILLPFGIAYQVIVMPSLYFLLFYVIASLIIPIIPLAIATGVIVLLFSFIPKVNNKDMFTYITSFLMLGVVLYMNTMTIGNENFLQDLLSEQAAFTNTISSFIPTVALLSTAVNKSNIVLIIISLLISISFMYIIIKVFSTIYFRGAIGISETSKKSKKRKVRTNNVNKQVSPKIQTLVKTDLKNIFRTPALMINYILPLLLMPIFLLIPTISAVTSEKFSLALIKQFIDEGRLLINSLDLITAIPYVIIGSFALTFFMASLSTITATAISREGERMEFYKSLPIKMMLVIRAKILIGFIVSIITPTILLILISVTLKPNVILIIISLLTIIIVSIFSNVFDIAFDVYKPKLVWDDETQAVKQNFVSIIPIFSSFFIIGLFLFIFFKLSKIQLFSSLLILVVLSILTVVIYKIVIEKHGLGHLDKAIEKL